MLDRAPAVLAKTAAALEGIWPFLCRDDVIRIGRASSARYAVCTGGRVPPERSVQLSSGIDRRDDSVGH